MLFAGLIAIVIAIVQLTFRRQFADKTVENIRLIGITPLASVSVQTWAKIGLAISAITIGIGIAFVVLSLQ